MSKELIKKTLEDELSAVNNKISEIGKKLAGVMKENISEKEKISKYLFILHTELKPYSIKKANIQQHYAILFSKPLD